MLARRFTKEQLKGCVLVRAKIELLRSVTNTVPSGTLGFIARTNRDGLPVVQFERGEKKFTACSPVPWRHIELA